MRVLIVSGIFDPEAGGPATYARGLAAKLSETAHFVTVVSFSNQEKFDGDEKYAFQLLRIVRGNKLTNRFRMFAAVFRLAPQFEVIYMLDSFAAGFPAALAARLRRVPYFVRVGGDYLWEHKYLERAAEPVTLQDYYERHLFARFESIFYFLVIRIVLHGAALVIFNSAKQRVLYGKYYGLTPQKTAVIFNPVPQGLPKRDSHVSSKEFVFWGRHIVMKNVSSLLRGFEMARLPEEFTLTLIGEGPRRLETEDLTYELGIEKRVRFLEPMKREAIWERVKNSRAVIIPSWTDVSPNQLYEAIALGLPALVTKENYLNVADQLPATIDPRSVEDIAEKISLLSDENQYTTFARKFRDIHFEHSWDDVAREHVELFKKVL